jgi:hypothetical protein
MFHNVTYKKLHLFKCKKKCYQAIEIRLNTNMTKRFHPNPILADWQLPSCKTFSNAGPIWVRVRITFNTLHINFTNWHFCKK